MTRFLALLAMAPLALWVLAPLAAGASEDEIRLESAPIDVRDVASLQAGARAFVNHCLNCHSASLMRYSQLRGLGLSDRQIMDNLMFTADKIGEMMTIAMTKKDAADWFGPAPDLSVIARSRGADWLWSYMRGYYRDAASPTGWNNTVFVGVGMPHVLWKLQGERVLKPMKDAAGNEMKDGNAIKTAAFQTIRPGTLSPVEYDTVVRDLVNFLVWMGEPNQVFRRQVGIVVVAFLFGFSLLTFFLYKEFWKDVH